MLETKTGKPYKSLWFGNFFEPAYGSAEFRADGIRRIRELGFNSVLLDSKAWQDFFERYEGKEASPYVAAQEHMMAEIEKNGLSYAFLAIYMNGDNLYPNIRFSPPIYGESITAHSGKDGRCYRYWSEKAQQSMIDHLSGLYRLYGKNASRTQIGGKERLPVCSMWDPIVQMSFDEDGRTRYCRWLENRYGDIKRFNQCYGLSANDFSSLSLDDVWYFEDKGRPTRADFENRTPLYYRYTDVLRWKADELALYFKEMQQKISALNPALYTSPVLSQWGMFLNVAPQSYFERDPGSAWDTCQRGIDPYRLAPFLDCCTFTTVPITENALPNAYASSCQNSMIRCMNQGREFTVGFYLGRYLYHDIYSVLTPCEMIGMAAASGASGYHSYGYGGLDDGGVMHKMMDTPFAASIKTGNAWFDRVLTENVPTGRKKEAAVLYPAEMALTEPYFVEGNPRRRRDMLGYYQSLCDLGLNVDVIHPMQAAECLSDYALLAIPDDSCYQNNPDPLLEEALREFVEQGGILAVDGRHPVLKRIFGIHCAAHPRQCFRAEGEGIVPGRGEFCTPEDGEALAVYEDSGKNAVSLYHFGKGQVVVFGFQYGAEYIAEETSAVPPIYGNRDFYPLCVAEHDPFRSFVRRNLSCPDFAQKGLETTWFKNCLFLVNHTSYPIDCSAISGEKDFQLPMNGMLAPHSAVKINF